MSDSGRQQFDWPHPGRPRAAEDPAAWSRLPRGPQVRSCVSSHLLIHDLVLVRVSKHSQHPDNLPRLYFQAIPLKHLLAIMLMELLTHMFIGVRFFPPDYVHTFVVDHPIRDNNLAWSSLDRTRKICDLQTASAMASGGHVRLC